jgi:hypothetical protein
MSTCTIDSFSWRTQPHEWVNHRRHWQNNIFLAFLGEFWQIRPSNFHFFGIRNNFFTYQGYQHCIQTPTWVLNCCWLSPKQWFWVPSPTRLITIIYSLTALRAFKILHSPQHGEPCLCIYSPSERVAQLYPQAPGSLFIAFCDSQGYCRIIVTRLHVGNTTK